MFSVVGILIFTFIATINFFEALLHFHLRLLFRYNFFFNFTSFFYYCMSLFDKFVGTYWRAFFL
jgi:hypothetical protein